MTLPVITGLEADPRRSGTLRIEIGGERFGAVPAELAASFGLVRGLTVSAELRERLAAAADAEAAYRTVLRSLERRAFARFDLGRRLRRKGHPGPAVDSALERAAELGLLDDAAFALNYVQTRTARGRGPSRLASDLMAMGVERSLVDRAIATEWNDDTDRTTVPRKLAEARAARLSGLPLAVKRRRVLAYLARRGFTGRDVSQMVVGLVKA
ncbi:MAG TPA: regulatory protein RecX [Gemmatimonadales bacterium]